VGRNENASWSDAARRDWIFVFQYPNRSSISPATFIDYERLATFEFGPRAGFNMCAAVRLLMVKPIYDAQPHSNRLRRRDSARGMPIAFDGSHPNGSHD
jgi:hypothetical protein